MDERDKAPQRLRPSCFVLGTVLVALRIEERGIRKHDCLPLSNPASRGELAWRYATVRLRALRLMQCAGKVDWKLDAEGFAHALSCRLLPIESELQSPALEDRREHCDVLRPAPVAQSKVGMECRQWVGEDKNAPPCPHPLVERDQFIR